MAKKVVKVKAKKGLKARVKEKWNAGKEKIKSKLSRFKKKAKKKAVKKLK